MDEGDLRRTLQCVILDALEENGPMTTKQLYRYAQKKRPELCDDDVYDDFGPLWRHLLRRAQQDLKHTWERIELVDRRWQLIE